MLPQASSKAPLPLPPLQVIVLFSILYLVGFWGLTASAQWAVPAVGAAATGAQLAFFYAT